MSSKNIILKKIKKYIDEYDRIYVFQNKDLVYKPFIWDILQHASGNCLMLVKESIPDSMLECSIDILSVSDEEYCEIEKLYYLYEFSDRVHILSHNAQYGSLDNYTANGLLTEEEALLALLG